MTELITPHGGSLVNLIAPETQIPELKKEAVNYKSLTLNERQLCDIELLMNGAFSPLTGFMNKVDYESVIDKMHLANGILWTVPITLDVDEELAKSLSEGEKLALRDLEGNLLAVLDVEDIWQPDLKSEAENTWGTMDKKHPAVSYLLESSKSFYIGGKITGIQLPKHYDYQELRQTPAELRDEFQKKGWTKIVAFQTRNPMHRAHRELTLRAAQEVGANLLVHPVVGMTKPGDVDHHTRVRCYKTIMPHYPENTATLSLYPLAMRLGGPRETIWHGIIRKNYGCSHFIVGRDHAGPGNDSNGKPFYGPYDAQELFQKFEGELEIKMVPFKMMVYVPAIDGYKAVDELKEGAETKNISGTQLRDMLASGGNIPEWFTYPDVVEELRKTHPPKSKMGFTVFFTGLSGSGKSTIANALLVKLMEKGGRNVTLLDGDVVRLNLSKGLGFSKEDRDANIARIGYVASEITKNGGAAICAPIAPYESIRKLNRDLISSMGAYIEVHISTPIDICEQRDTKGLYAKARQGILKGFTGVDDPYEVPENPEIRIDTTVISVEESVDMIMGYLEKEGYIQ
ncbi:bifunctional sulfate adenylyltransferase/adenylylsulfate kinase [Bacteroidota bacterium]